MSTNRYPFIKPGFFGWFYKGMKAPGLDLHKVVRDVLNQCGYPCIKCDEVDTSSCADSLINPNIRTIIADYETRIAALEGSITTDNTQTAQFFNTPYPVASLTVPTATNIIRVYIA